MQANCTHCGSVAQFAITYEDALGVQVQEASCGDCADARSARESFNQKRLSAVEVDF